MNHGWAEGQTVPKNFPKISGKAQEILSRFYEESFGLINHDMWATWLSRRLLYLALQRVGHDLQYFYSTIYRGFIVDKSKIMV